MKIVNKDWLRSKIDELNEWIRTNQDDPKLNQQKQARDYYVNKLCELEEYNYRMIEV